MGNKTGWHLFLLLWLVLLLAISVVGCALNPRYIYENGAVQIGGDGEPIELINNPDSTSPTYAELIAFVIADSTDTNAYLEGGPRDYVCSDFAEDVHNNAEAAGIKAAWVSIAFEGNDEGHACNAFETTDRGLVYIDCTGDNRGFVYAPALEDYVKQHIIPGSLPESEPSPCDTIAYIEIGKEYGLIDIVKAKSLSYSFYEECKRKWQECEILLSEYNEEVMQYNEEMQGKIYYEGSPELARMEAWEARLKEKSRMIDELRKELGDFWFEPLGVIKDILIHW